MHVPWSWILRAVHAATAHKHQSQNAWLDIASQRINTVNIHYRPRQLCCNPNGACIQPRVLHTLARQITLRQRRRCYFTTA
jgi:hypothetical protein